MNIVLPDGLLYSDEDFVSILERIWSICNKNNPLAHYLNQYRELVDAHAMYIAIKFLEQDLENIDWNIMYKWANYIAIDNDNEVYAFAEKPVYEKNINSGVH